MKTKQSKHKARRPFQTLQRRWMKSRPGSVLILVIALLVLLALIGTAFLSTTQTERYASQQNLSNAEADILFDGVENTVKGTIAGGLFVGTQYRPPGQEMPTYVNSTPTAAPSSTYHSYDSGFTDSFLADRWPVLNGNPIWNSISWPMFADPTGNVSFDSPFDGSTTLFLASNKSIVQSLPFYRYINNQYYPGMVYFIPPTSVIQGTGASQVSGGCTLNLVQPTDATKVNGVTLQTTAGAMYVQNSSNGVYITPSGLQLSLSSIPMVPPSIPYSWVNFAASASGDGIADGGMSKVPVGPINNITYYYSTRIIDNNSAVNVSSAWTAQNDQTPAGVAQSNYGMFRSNVGLNELLLASPPYSGAPTAVNEMSALNIYRATGVLNVPTGSGPLSGPALSATPFPDTPAPSPAAPSNFTYWSVGDMFDSQMTRRPGNPGYSSLNTKFNWLGLNQSAALAYHFSLKNPNISSSVIEQLLPNELVNYPDARTTPYSPSQIPLWYNDLFANYQASGVNTGPLRTLLTGDNPVSNAISSRLGNASAGSTPTWVAGANYKFGDWVLDGPPGYQRSFVCVRPHTATTALEPQSGGQNLTATTTPPYAGYNVAAVGTWAGAQAPPTVYNTRPPGLPFTQQAVKSSVNTATFEELWLAFAQVMTDSIGLDNNTSTGPVGVSHWQPPMQPQLAPSVNKVETQMGMFRSTIRDPRYQNQSALLLSPSQMLKLRAALAAVNTIDLRDSDNDVTSKHIVLENSKGTLISDGTAAGQAYDVEVYGTEMQPYISEVAIQLKANADGTFTKFVAIELCNPYSKVITLTNWQIGSVNRAAYAPPTTLLTMSAGVPIPTVTIPAANMSGTFPSPGLLVLYEDIGDATAEYPDLFTTMQSNQATYSTTTTSEVVPGLATAAIGGTAVPLQPNELFIMRPRRADGTPTKSTSGDDLFDETTPLATVADFVPADQMDFTGMKMPVPPTKPAAPPTTYRYLYRRGCDPTKGVAWNFVFPGYYDPTPKIAFDGGRYGSTSSSAQSAIYFDVTGKFPCNLGAPTGTYTAPTDSAATASYSTFTTVPIELNNTFMAGPNPVYTVSAGVTTPSPTISYPFGGFARNGDLMQIPFIGAYRIRPYNSAPTATVSPTMLELNSVSMDSALANDDNTGVSAMPVSDVPTATVGTANQTAVTPYFTEQIGRFCPVGNPQGGNDTAKLDFGTTNTYYHYHWARKLFNYLTVQAPHDDYYPNADPTPADSNISSLSKYPNAGGSPPVPVANGSTSLANSVTAGVPNSEDTVGNQGLININTAPLPVLASLPFTTPYNALANYTIAQGIITYRKNAANPPFKSITDLYRVPEFYNQSAAVLATPAGPAQGVFSPGGIGAGATTPTYPVRFDFQEKFLLMNNISNLVTTRSDSFTCYVLLQGWRNAGTSNPTLAVQRRGTLIVDRNTVSPGNNRPAYYKAANQ